MKKKGNMGAVPVIKDQRENRKDNYCSEKGKNYVWDKGSNIFYSSAC